MSNTKTAQTKALMREALTDSYKRGYSEGSADALNAAADAFADTGASKVAEMLRRMAAIDPTEFAPPAQASE